MLCYVSTRIKFIWQQRHHKEALNWDNAGFVIHRGYALISFYDSTKYFSRFETHELLSFCNNIYVTCSCICFFQTEYEGFQSFLYKYFDRKNKVAYNLVHTITENINNKICSCLFVQNRSYGFATFSGEDIV